MSWLMKLPHRHAVAVHPSVGEVQFCHLFGKVHRTTYRRDENSTAYEVAIDDVPHILACETYEEAIALVRSRRSDQ
jgi:hypothetical protein